MSSPAYPPHHAIPTGPLTRCQVCHWPKLQPVIDLGHQPLCDTLLTAETRLLPEITYPLRVVWCPQCTCVQLDYCVDGKVVFHPDYPYRSGISKPLAEYQKNIATSLIEAYRLSKKDLVVDIGSNDGTLLSGFKEHSIRTLGVEPTNVAKIANRLGIKTMQSFFDRKTAKTILQKYGPAKVITTTNVFAHMQTLGEVIVGVHDLLTPDGVFISETHYLLDIVRDGQFDSFYHEHLRTYSLRSLIALFAPYDFTVTDVERGTRYGGNIRVHVTKGKGRNVSPRVAELLKLEKEAGLHRLKTYKAFAQRVKKSRRQFTEFLVKTQHAKKSVVGKTSPGRAATLLNYYGVDADSIPYLAEQPTSLKLGLLVPGTRIPVVADKHLLKDQPDYVVIFAWHYAIPIMKRLKAAGLTSDFVVPLPQLKIIKNNQVKI